MKHVLDLPLPKARTEKLIIKELLDETLVYDLESDKAHCLNSTAALVWQKCDGRNSVAKILSSLENDTGTLIDERVVWLALDQLENFDLLERALTRPTHLVGMNRRQLVRNIGAAALALPVIMSIASPTAAQTASQCACTTPNCRVQNCPCTNPGDCVNPLSCPPATNTCQP